MKTIEKISQAYDKWIGDKPTQEEVKFAEDSCDPIIAMGFIGGYNTCYNELKSEEKEKSKAVKELVMYLFDDELRDYSENPSDNHIFLKLMKLKELFGIEIENMCMSVFYEEYLKNIIDGKGNDAERCPVCSKGDALMDI